MYAQAELASLHWVLRNIDLQEKSDFQALHYSWPLAKKSYSNPFTVEKELVHFIIATHTKCLGYLKAR